MTLFPFEPYHRSMRYGVLADIHSNLEALDAVLNALEDHDVSAYLCTGDIVGYGADPEACLERVRDLSATVVAGNHDWAVAEKLDLDYFNPHAREAIYWTQAHLQRSHVRYLSELPLQTSVGEATLVHGTLYSPENFDYLLTSYDAHLSFQVLQTKLCLVGHSHVPVTFALNPGVTFTFDTEIDLGQVDRAIINPGSVGQPRDENPKAAYAVYDADAQTFSIHRVEYDIEAAAMKILQAGLPEVLAERLWVGR